jgi:sugar lactone lactonase YvrE
LDYLETDGRVLPRKGTVEIISDESQRDAPYADHRPSGSGPVFKVELVLDAKAEVAESPYWDESDGSLWWVDLLKGELHRLNSDGKSERILGIGRSLGFIAPLASGGILAGAKDGFGVVTNDLVEERYKIEQGASYRVNDGKCDGQGRLWAGTTSDALLTGGALYRLDLDGSLTRLRDDLRLPNGMAWSKDGRTMFLADSGAGCIEVWDFDTRTGVPTSRRRVIDVPGHRGVPDGMTIDQQDNVWVAHFGGGCVQCYAADGTLGPVIEIPAQNVTSCTFGGSDYRDLYITTARYARTAAELAAEPHAGGLFRCRPGVQGRRPDPFAGPLNEA